MLVTVRQARHQMYALLICALSRCRPLIPLRCSARLLAANASLRASAVRACLLAVQSSAPSPSSPRICALCWCPVPAPEPTTVPAAASPPSYAQTAANSSPALFL